MPLRKPKKNQQQQLEQTSIQIQNFGRLGPKLDGWVPHGSQAQNESEQKGQPKLHNQAHPQCLLSRGRPRPLASGLSSLLGFSVILLSLADEGRETNSEKLCSWELPLEFSEIPCTATQAHTRNHAPYSLQRIF